MTPGAGAPPARRELWDFQDRIIAEAQDALRTSRSLMIAAPCGAGKTVILAEILTRTSKKNLRGALLVHRQELVKQSCNKIAAQSGTDPGVVWQSRPEWDQPITVGVWFLFVLLWRRSAMMRVPLLRVCGYARTFCHIEYGEKFVHNPR